MRDGRARGQPELESLASRLPQALLEVGDSTVVITGPEGEQPHPFEKARSQRGFCVKCPRSRRIAPLDTFSQEATQEPEERQRRHQAPLRSASPRR